MDLTYDQNRRRIQAEVPKDKQWAVLAGLDAAWKAGQYFDINEIKRTQARQNNLILYGRLTPDDFWLDVQNGWMTKWTALRGIALLKMFGGKPGARKTWTLDSLHLQGLAMDVMLLDPKGSYDELANTLAPLGITHPLKTNDAGHFEFNQIGPQPVPEPVVHQTPEAKMKGLQGRLARVTTEGARRLIEFVIANLRRRMK